MKYAFALIDGNQAPDQYLFAESRHRTLDAARAAAARRNSDPNAHYYVIAWDAPRWAKLSPNDAHYPV
jgi:hypothetical protein